MPASGGKSGGKGGSSGSSNAALNSDEDLMNRRKILFHQWKSKKAPRALLEYEKSPHPPIKRTK